MRNVKYYTIDSLYEVLEGDDLGLHAGLGEGVVVLYPLHKMLETPETVCLDPLQSLGRQLGEIVGLRVLVSGWQGGRKWVTTVEYTNKERTLGMTQRFE